MSRYAEFKFRGDFRQSTTKWLNGCLQLNEWRPRSLTSAGAGGPLEEAASPTVNALDFLFAY
jgi:hypothetical protein